MNPPMKSPHQHSLAIDAVIYGLPHGDCTNHCCGCCDQLRNHPAGHKDQHASMYYTTLDVLNGVICTRYGLFSVTNYSVVNMSCYTMGI